MPTSAGRQCCGDMVDAEWRSIAQTVTATVFEDGGHYVPEEKPDEVLTFVVDTLRIHRERAFDD